MQYLKLNGGDLLIIDPGYIKDVYFRNEDRFDGLKCVKTLHEGDDGEYSISYPVANNVNETTLLGVDSGRIWVLKAEFEIMVEIDAGLSGYKYLLMEGKKDEEINNIIDHIMMVGKE